MPLYKCEYYCVYSNMIWLLSRCRSCDILATIQILRYQRQYILSIRFTSWVFVTQEYIFLNVNFLFQVRYYHCVSTVRTFSLDGLYIERASDILLLRVRALYSKGKARQCREQQVLKLTRESYNNRIGCCICYRSDKFNSDGDSWWKWRETWVSVLVYNREFSSTNFILAQPVNIATGITYCFCNLPNLAEHVISW